ncbi:hypothetical protein ACVWYG_000809 [Pedobacter sp. UYEF25]
MWITFLVFYWWASCLDVEATKTLTYVKNRNENPFLRGMSLKDRNGIPDPSVGHELGTSVGQKLGRGERPNDIINFLANDFLFFWACPKLRKGRVICLVLE